MKRKALLSTLFFSLLVSQQGLAASELAQQLKEQAQFWAQRGKEENAIDAWRKLHAIEPNNPDALLALVIFEAAHNNTRLAQSYYEKLRSSSANSNQIRLAGEALKNAGKGTGQLDQARKLARAGDSDGAIEAYRQLGDPNKLKGDAAMEYLIVLAGSKTHYEEGKRGLEKLNRENPNNTQYALSYAKVLTYREGTRLQGLAMLEKLTQKSSVAKQAADAWRETLSWMGANAASVTQVQRYLKLFPDDTAAQDLLVKLQRNLADQARARTQVSEAGTATQSNEPSSDEPKVINKKVAKVDERLNREQAAGFRALEKNDLKSAEQHFQYLVKNYPKDSVGHGGMGLIKLRKEEFVDARKLIQKAYDLAPPAKKKDWQKALFEGNYWGTIADAQTAFEDSESEKGIALLRKAIAMNPNGPVAIQQLGDALRAENDMKGAEESFRTVLKIDPENQAAFDGLIGILATQKRIAELDELKPKMSLRQLTVLANLKASILWDQAKAQQTAGDLAGAQSSLEQAILLTPEDPWLRMALARIFIKQDRVDLAKALINAISEVENAATEAIYARALLSATLLEWMDTLTILERIPEAARRAEIADLQKRAWIRVQLKRLDQFIQRNQLNAAQALLGRIEAAASKDAEFIGIIASQYVKLGRTEQGEKMLANAIAASPKPNASLLIQYAVVLLKLEREEEVINLMRQVAAMPQLSDEESEQFVGLQSILALRYSERYRKAGDYASAYAYLQPLLINEPENPQYLLALSQLYAAAGDDESAQALYQEVLQTEPEANEVIQALVFAGITNKDYQTAEANLATLLAKNPNDPQLLSIAGSLARVQGNPGEALLYFRRALAITQAQRQVAGGRALPKPKQVFKLATPLHDFSINPFADSDFTLRPASIKSNNATKLKN